ncbi:DUF5703 domain-containing protein [uncultured Maribacter sp.]|uniref:DUF5703 domain-containing protein n=1 Tax=uncultured Maribacter sp. TaxID=431308 RepID=UPI002601BA82|nr:DUF5703 domain-containing protein [uncultured Maribacter sp.]
MKILNLHVFILVSFIWLFSNENQAQSLNWLDEYNVIWNSQSKNSGESMPCGGGDIGMNVWVEQGDILLYIDRSGNIDENDQLRKSGRLRIKMDPSPFSQDGKDLEFEQELDLKTGAVLIHGKSKVNNAKIRIWSEVHKPMIHVELESSQKSKVSAIFESWRNEKQLIPISDVGNGGGGGRDYNRWGCYGYVSYKGDVYAYPDHISFKNNNTVLFYHQNSEDLIFDKEVQLQRLDSVTNQLRHTTKNRIFGGVMFGENLVKGTVVNGAYSNTPYKGWELKSIKPSNQHHIQIALHTEQNEDIEEWKTNLEAIAKEASSIEDKRLKAAQWWANFWNRSYVIINQGKGVDDIGWQVGRNYQLMRYMLGCNAYGEFPTHFNGGMFIFDHYYVDGKENMNPSFYNADYRKWMAWTGMNQRLVHWPFLKSGDFEEMRPQFDFYRLNNTNARLRNKVSFGIDGSSFAEQCGSQGLPNGYHYGWEPPYGNRNPKAEVGMQGHHKNYFHTQLEFAYMMHEWYRFTNKDISEYISFMKDAVVFHFEYHKMLQKRRTGKEWGKDGKLVLKDMQATETYKMGENPALEVTALKKNLKALIQLPEKWVANEEKATFKDWLKRVPDLEFRNRNGHKVIAPLKVGDFRMGNREIPQLYPVFPYGDYAIGQPNIEIGINTWKYGLDKATAKYILEMYGKDEVYPQKEEWWGWGQQAIFLARLGLTNEAKTYVSKKLSNAKGDPWGNPKEARFPAFWGPGYGCLPSMEWGASGMIAIQEMLLQTISNQGKDLRILPAWPQEWNVQFKLHAPNNTTVECALLNKKIQTLTVMPEYREKDIIINLNEN